MSSKKRKHVPISLNLHQQGIFNMISFLMALLCLTCHSTALASPPQSPSFGTLLIILPTRDGIIFAADGRTTIQNQHCDVVKIRIVEGMSIAFATTGNPIFLPIAPPNTDMCKWLQETKPTFSADEIVEHTLRNKKAGFLDKELLLELGEKLKDPLKQSFTNSPQSIAQFLGKDIFRVAIVHYNAQKKESTFGSLLLKADQQGTVLCDSNDAVIKKWKHTDRADIMRVGETEYFQKQVLNGPGANLLGEDIINLYNKLYSKLKPVAEIKYLDAAGIAYAMISATSKMTEKVPAPSGIGGPIQIVLINGKPPDGSVELKGPFVPTPKTGGRRKSEK